MGTAPDFVAGAGAAVHHDVTEGERQTALVATIAPGRLRPALPQDWRTNGRIDNARGSTLTVVLVTLEEPLRNPMLINPDGPRVTFIDPESGDAVCQEGCGDAFVAGDTILHVVDVEGDQSWTSVKDREELSDLYELLDAAAP